jgi:hypothetical protein
LAVHFAEGQARATYRYVQTEGYLEETKANKLIFLENGAWPPKGLCRERFGKSSKNVAKYFCISSYLINFSPCGRWIATFSRFGNLEHMAQEKI